MIDVFAAAERFASSGGPFRWGWVALLAFVVVTWVLAQAGRLARFVARAVARGWRESMRPDAAAQTELRARFAGDLHTLIDRRAQDRGQ